MVYAVQPAVVNEEELGGCWKRWASRILDGLESRSL